MDTVPHTWRQEEDYSNNEGHDLHQQAPCIKTLASHQVVVAKDLPVAVQVPLTGADVLQRVRQAALLSGRAAGTQISA